MTLDELRALAEKSLGTNEKSLGTNEKSLGAENSAGVDALSDAAQQALESNSLAGILLREHDNVEQAINYAERMAQRYANFKSLMAMEYQDAAEELKAWKQAHGIGEGE